MPLYLQIGEKRWFKLAAHDMQHAAQMVNVLSSGGLTVKRAIISPEAVTLKGGCEVIEAATGEM